MSKRSKKKERKERSTAAAAKRRAETHKTGFDNTAFELPEDKKLFAIKSDKSVRLDIIPYEVGEGNPFADKGELHYERTYWVHRSIGVDQTSFVCLRKTCEEPCPICDFRAKLAKDPDADEDLIKSLAPKERQLFNVINTKEPDKGVQIWEISYHLFGKRLDQEIKNSDEDDGYENFAELEGGFTLKLGIEEKSFNRQSFYEVVSVNFKPRDDDYDEDILEQTTCLDDILIIKEYDELKEILLQTADDDDDDDEKATTKKNKKKSKKKEKSKESDWNEGDRVVVEIDGTDYLGVITNVDEDEETAEVEFDDGDTQDIAFDDLDMAESESEPEEDDIPFEEGDRVSAEIDGETYEGVIKKIKDDKAKVLFDDGDKNTFDLDDLTKLEEEEEKSSKKDKGKKGKGKVKAGECPFGGTFGKDCETLPECNDCPVWDKCDDAHDAQS